MFIKHPQPIHIFNSKSFSGCTDEHAHKNRRMLGNKLAIQFLNTKRASLTKIHRQGFKVCGKGVANKGGAKKFSPLFNEGGTKRAWRGRLSLSARSMVLLKGTIVMLSRQNSLPLSVDDFALYL